MNVEKKPGRLISQGGFGCVYYPGIKCNGSIDLNKKYLSKLQKKDFNSKNEIDISRVVKTIPHYQSFFVPIHSHCDINLSQISPHLLSDCEVISGHNEMKYILMRIQYVQNRFFFSFLMDYTKRHIVLNIIELYSYLLNSIKKLLKKKIVHFDLKNENILFDIQTNNPLIIDFGISINMDTLHPSNYLDYFYTFSPKYYIWPLEVHFINFILHEKNVATKKDVEKLCDVFVDNNKGLVIFSKGFIKKYRQSCVSYLSRFISKPGNDCIEELLQYYTTWDNYAISILYFRILAFMFGTGFFENKFIVSFSQLLLLNISPDPRKRRTIDDSLRIFQGLFYKNDRPTDYLVLLKNFRIDREEVSKKVMNNNAHLSQIAATMMH